MADLPLITSEDFDALEPEWAALHARVSGASPFLHPLWHRLWLRNFGQRLVPVFLAVRRGEELVGVAALEMDREVARELGDHNVRDYAGPVALAGEEQAVAAGILEWLREDLTPGAVFWGLAADAPMLAALRQAASAGGWSSEEEHEAVCPGVDLPLDFETFVSALSKKDRHELRRKLRNFESAGTPAFESMTAPDAIEREMPELFRLMRISREDKDEFLTPEMESFFHDLGREFGALGMVRLSKLSIGTTPVAMTLAFEDETTAYLYNSGFDPEYASLAVGLVSKAHAIRDSIECGKRRFDFLRGDEDYKRRLGGIDREIVTIRLKT